MTVLHGDFREESKKIPDFSVDLIFTDSSYTSRDVLLYKDLAIVAFRVLQDGGSLVTYANHCLIPEITKFMKMLASLVNGRWLSSFQVLLTISILRRYR
jgi:hypothetical protein